MKAEPQRPVLYVDDGHPESRDYDDNYVAIEAQEPRGLLQAVLRFWRPRGGGQHQAPLRPATKSVPA